MSVSFQNTHHNHVVHALPKYTTEIQNTHQTCQIFFFSLSFLPTGGRMLEVVDCAFLMSKFGGATLKVMPPAVLGGPHEHAGPIPGTLGGSIGFPMRSTRTFSRLFGLAVYGTIDLNLLPTLVLVSKLILAFFLV
jgi:hypothetical protein